MAKYSREQRDRAVDLYVRYERCAADVIRELGYPSRGMLPVWYRERLEEYVLLQCLFSRLISIFPQCGRMVFPGLVIMQSVM